MQEIFERMQQIIAEQFAGTVEVEDITEETTFDDLGADSVDLVELIMAMEDEFQIGEVEEDDLNSLTNVGDCVKYISEHTK